MPGTLPQRPAVGAHHARSAACRAPGSAGRRRCRPRCRCGRPARRRRPARPAPRPRWAGCRPGADGGVDLGHARHAAGVVRQRRVGRQVVAADGLHQAAEDAVAVAGHQHVAVGAAVGVAGRDAGQRAAGGLAHGAEGAVLGQQAFHAVEHALVQRHVDHLPLARFTSLAVVQRHQDADHAVQRRQRVADAHAHAHRRAAGLGRQVAQPAHGLGHHAEAGLVAVGAGLAVAADAQHDQARVGRAARRRPRPQPSIAPGRKFSISTSASPPARTACALGVRRSSATERLLRDCTCHHTEVPSAAAATCAAGRRRRAARP
jgi:hypothetical protein